MGVCLTYKNIEKLKEITTVMFFYWIEVTQNSINMTYKWCIIISIYFNYENSSLVGNSKLPQGSKLNVTSGILAVVKLKIRNNLISV